MNKQLYKITKFKGRVIHIPSSKVRFLEYYIKKVLSNYITSGNSVVQICNSIKSLLDHPNVNYLVKLDIHSFFDSINTDYLLEKLYTYEELEKLIPLIKNIILNGGLKTGSTISNLLANVYLEDTLKVLNKKYKFCRYVDDFLFFADTEEAAVAMKKDLEEEFAKINLKFNNKGYILHKTDKRNKFLGLTFYYSKEHEKTNFFIKKSTKKRFEKKYDSFYKKIILCDFDNVEKLDKLLSEINHYTQSIFKYYMHLPINFKKEFYFSNKIIYKIADEIGFTKVVKKSGGISTFLYNELHYFDTKTKKITLLERCY